MLTVIGFMGVLEMKKWFIVAHALLTTGIIGTCFLYSILEILFRKKEEQRVKLWNICYLIMLYRKIIFLKTPLCFL